MADPVGSSTPLPWKRTALLFVGHLLNGGFASFFAPLLPLLIDRLDLSPGHACDDLLSHGARREVGAAIPQEQTRCSYNRKAGGDGLLRHEPPGCSACAVPVLCHQSVEPAGYPLLSRELLFRRLLEDRPVTSDLVRRVPLDEFEGKCHRIKR